MEEKKRNRYRLGGMTNPIFTSVSDAKYYILTHKEEYKGHNGNYKAVSVYCGFNEVGRYMYVADLKRLVKL